MFKKINVKVPDITLSELIDRYTADYYLTVIFNKSGGVNVFIGTRRDEFEASEIKKEDE